MAGTQKMRTKGLALALMMGLSIISNTMAAPPLEHAQGRKFAVKPNNPKKMYHKSHLDHKMDLDKNLNSYGKQKMTGDYGGFNEKVMMMGPEYGGHSKNDLTSNNDENGSNGNLAWAMAGPIIQLARMFLTQGAPGGSDLISNGLGSSTSAEEKLGQLDVSATEGFSWGRAIGYGLKLLFIALGGEFDSDAATEKMDEMRSPVQTMVQSLVRALVGPEDDGETMAKQATEFINLVMALMNAMKTSFSQRALRARSIGERDRISDLSLAAIDMGKAYARSWNTSDDSCKQQFLCEAAQECMNDLTEPNSFGFCHLTAYATTNLMYYTQKNKSDRTKMYMSAVRKGRSLADCRKLFICNEILN